LFFWRSSARALEHGHGHHEHSDDSSTNKSDRASLDGGPATEIPREGSSVKVQERRTQPSGSRNRSQSIPVRQSSDSFIENFGHPATFRESFNVAADEMRKARSPSPPPKGHVHTFSAPVISITGEPEGGRNWSSRSDRTLTPRHEESQHELGETAPLIQREDGEGEEEHNHGHSHRGKSLEGAHGHGHGHGSMNMKAILLHVLGDALGNVGVIATGLIIWQTTWSFKYYFDPIISLVITAIIFSSAMPLGQSFSL